MKFTKMHGIGNDYVYVNGFEEKIKNPSQVAILVSDRHFGIGSDGLILINPSSCADVEMEMYNADGSRGEMCGNGIRSVAKYVYEKGLSKKTELTIETLAGIKTVQLEVKDGEVYRITVDMGSPILETNLIPVVSETSQMIEAPFEVDGHSYKVTCVSMGNPHCVIFIEEDVSTFDLEGIGPKFEQHERFPRKTNTEFVHVVDEHTLKMRVWERGSGETLACGTGACATAVAAILGGYTANEVTVQLRGGDLQIKWDREQNTVFMSGTATMVFEGETDLSALEQGRISVKEV